MAERATATPGPPAAGTIDEVRGRSEKDMPHRRVALD
jgi:hypothetical protein